MSYLSRRMREQNPQSIREILLDVVSDAGVAMNTELAALYYETKYDLHYILLLYHAYREIAREAGVRPGSIVTYNVRQCDAYELLQKLTTVRENTKLLPAQKNAIETAITLCTGYIYGSGRPERSLRETQNIPRTIKTVYPFQVLQEIASDDYPRVIPAFFYHTIGFFENNDFIRLTSKKLKDLLLYFIAADRGEIRSSLSKDCISSVTHLLSIAVDEIMAGGWRDIETDIVKREYYIEGSLLNVRVIGLLDDVLRWYGTNTHVALAYAKCMEQIYK